MVKINRGKNSIILFLAVLAFILIISTNFQNLISLENLREHKDFIKESVNSNYILSLMSFMILGLFLVNSPVPMTAAMKVTGGFLFGGIIGSLLNIITTTIAAVLGFFAVRYLFKEQFEKKYAHKLREIETRIENEGFYYFLSMRIMFIVPYFLINVLGGISRISLKKYTASTVIGVIPGSIVYGNAGSKIEQIDSVESILSGELLLSFLLVAILILIPTFLNSNRK